MENFKSLFTFTYQQRKGILWLLFVIGALLSAYYFIDFSDENNLDMDSSEIVSLQNQMDSLLAIKKESLKPKIYPFNPNFISDYKGYVLGMTNEEIDRLLQYRKQNKWINSAKEFQRVTKVSDSFLNKISPFFKFPEWVTNPTQKKRYQTSFKKEKTVLQKKDLNLATLEDLQKVYGIGLKLSTRIINFREQLGGFTANQQLYNIYGLKEEVILNVLKEFEIKTPKVISKININTASASDIATLPGVSFELAKQIWEFRKLRGSIKNFSELEKIEGLSKRKLDKIQLYLSIK
ncbi:MAG: ComEA family DNA-binding protein [Flavobacteriales bacterium]